MKENELTGLDPGLEARPHVLYRNLYRFTKNFIGGSVTMLGECLEGPRSKSETFQRERQAGFLAIRSGISKPTGLTGEIMCLILNIRGTALKASRSVWKKNRYTLEP